MQPVYTGVSIVGRHDCGQYPLRLGDSLGPWIRYLNILFPKATAALLRRFVVGLVVNVLLGTAVCWMCSLERLAQTDAERVLSVGKLVYEIASVAPHREARAD
jgi:hypothetical protein